MKTLNIKSIFIYIYGWLRANWIIILLILPICFLLKIVELAIKSPPDLTNWLLVYLTAIYSLLTFLLAIIAWKSAISAERAAKAMEISIYETRMDRLVAFSASIGFPNGYTYIENQNSTVNIEIENSFEQPIMWLRCFFWLMEKDPSGKRTVKYSSILQSDFLNISSDQKRIAITLKKINITDSESINWAKVALDRYLSLNSNPPESALCMIMYVDRASIAVGPKLFVCNLYKREKPNRTPIV